jgi:hypothetical protein
MEENTGSQALSTVSVSSLHFLRLKAAIESIMYFANRLPLGSDDAISLTTKFLSLNFIEILAPPFNCDKYASCPTPCILGFV